jgi:hypothetical protein
LSAKERYINAKARLADIEVEKAGLEEIVNGYKPIIISRSGAANPRNKIKYMRCVHIYENKII